LIFDYIKRKKQERSKKEKKERKNKRRRREEERGRGGRKENIKKSKIHICSNQTLHRTLMVKMKTVKKH
jgi:hypothetical protein